MYKYLVVMYYFATNTTEPQIIADTEERAEKWIKDKMEGYVYSGAGVHKIIELVYVD